MFLHHSLYQRILTSSIVSYPFVDEILFFGLSANVQYSFLCILNIEYAIQKGMQRLQEVNIRPQRLKEQPA